KQYHLHSAPQRHAGPQRRTFASEDWLCRETGLLRSQYVALSLEQYVSSTASIVAQRNAAGPTMPDSTIREVSDLCADIVSVPEALPLVKVLLAVDPLSTLSERFLETITAMSIAGKIQLCYEERLILWSQYLPSFEQELLDLCERVLQLKSVSDSSAEIKQLVYTKDLPRACIGHQYLLSFAEEFFRALTATSQRSQLVLRLIECFNHCLDEVQEAENIPHMLRAVIKQAPPPF
ncbi:hypothetical protein EMCRGX_G019780, partial [Ephydatia muelleri]